MINHTYLVKRILNGNAARELTKENSANYNELYDKSITITPFELYRERVEEIKHLISDTYIRELENISGAEIVSLIHQVTTISHLLDSEAEDWINYYLSKYTFREMLLKILNITEEDLINEE